MINDQMFLKCGYITFAADIYGNGNRGESREEWFGICKRHKDDRTVLVRGRLMAAFDRMKRIEQIDAEKVGERDRRSTKSK